VKGDAPPKRWDTEIVSRDGARVKGKLGANGIVGGSEDTGGLSSVALQKDDTPKKRKEEIHSADIW
jgi:hypothetical protein